MLHELEGNTAGLSSQRHLQFPTQLLSSYVTWARPWAPLDAALRDAGPQASSSTLGPGSQASSFAQSKNVEVSPAFPVSPHPNHPECRHSCLPRSLALGKEVQGIASWAASPGTGPCATLSSRAWALPQSSEAEIAAWMGHVSARGSFFFFFFFLLPRISASIGIHLSQELPSAQRGKKKQTKDTLPEQGGFLPLTVSP